MDGAHDMGGMHGFGPVVEDGAELAYHERWEPRVFALQLLIGVEGLGAGPGGRAMREEMDPAEYLAASYYERWLYSAEQRLLRKGTVAPGDVEAMTERLRTGESVPEHRDAAMAERMLENLRTRVPMVLREFGLELGDEVEIRVWDSSAEVRYLVLPMRPEGTDGWSEDQLAAIVTRDCMIGTALPSANQPAIK